MDKTTEKAAKNPVEQEKERLLELYKEVPESRLQLLDGLIDQAARLRVRLTALWQDLVENGETELFTQSPNTPPYERTRPAAQLYTQAGNLYKNIIRQLDEIHSEYPDTDGNLMDFLKEFEDDD